MIGGSCEECGYAEVNPAPTSVADDRTMDQGEQVHVPHAVGGSLGYLTWVDSVWWLEFDGGEK